MFCEKDVLKNFKKFAGKHLCQSLFFNKVYRTPPVAASATSRIGIFLNRSRKNISSTDPLNRLVHCSYKHLPEKFIRRCLYERRVGPLSGLTLFPRSHFYRNILLFPTFAFTIKRPGLPVKISCLKGEIGYT